MLVVLDAEVMFSGLSYVEKKQMVILITEVLAEN